MASPPPEQQQPTWRYSAQGWQQISTGVIGETDVTLFVNGEEWLTLACTPTNLEALAVGFLYNEGIVRAMADIALVKPCNGGCNLDVWLNKTVERPRHWRRTSGCTGGVTSTQASLARPAATDTHAFSAESILAAMDQLLEVQALYRETRGVHCSAISDGQSIRYLAEDIGRHNTLDKLAGMLLLKPEILAHRLMLTTGRISAEMLQKSARLEVAVVISRSSPTTLSIEQAQTQGITLIGYARHGQFSVYTHPERVLIPATWPE
jgi:FdhD protein